MMNEGTESSASTGEAQKCREFDVILLLDCDENELKT